MSRATALDGEGVVSTVWGLDAPHTVEELGEAMLALQHLIRWSNHATLNAPRTVLPDAENVATVARRLGDALGGLPQLLDQLAGRCDGMAEDPALRAAQWNGPDDPRRAASSAAAELRAVSAVAGALRERIQRAASAMTTIYLDDEDGR
ncbi:hypothetical protein [Nocardia noduli]|uniref:hypothetical protein n=1 Tax=Nocardia noduli TaxID=2815722 RepID=UPI001C247E08|nr:hypothetical protein [Nocardia noduli]